MSLRAVIYAQVVWMVFVGLFCRGYIIPGSTVLPRRGNILVTIVFFVPVFFFPGPFIDVGLIRRHLLQLPRWKAAALIAIEIALWYAYGIALLPTVH